MRRNRSMKHVKRQQVLVGLIAAALVVSASWTIGTIIELERTVRDYSKMNYELQLNSDKLQELNDMQHDRIRELEKQAEKDAEAIKRLQTISKADIEKIQRVVMAEARGGEFKDMVGVTQTILNRSQLWNKKAAEVVSAKYQYADPYPGEINDNVKKAFEAVYLDGAVAFREPVTHFYNEQLCSPAWAEKLNYAGNVGAHRYMY